jgi:hypothetical protein
VPRMFRPSCRSALLRACGVRPQFNPTRCYASLKRKAPRGKEFDQLSSEEQLTYMDQLNTAAEINPTVDFWSIETDLLGECSCYISIKSR